MSFRGVKRRGNPLNRNATQWRLPLTALVLTISTAQKIFAISSSRDKNSCHNFARLSAWLVRLWRKRINENLFRAFLYTECAYSGCEPQRRREKGAPSIAQTALRLWQPTRMSFRGAKRRGNPLNRIENKVAVAIDRTCSRNHYRAENLCYQFEQGQNSCHNSARLSAW